MTELALIAKATVILGVALIATRVARTARASVRSLILALAFGLVLILPLASAIAPPRELQIPDGYAPAFLLDELSPSSPAARAPAPLPNAPPPPESRLPSVASLTRATWLLGFIASMAPLLLGLWRLRDVRNRSRVWVEGRELADVLRASVGVRRVVAVMMHDALSAPMTCGWRRPAIAMPADASDWPAAEIRQALLHELEHVRRHDWPIHVAARLACALYWFHPAAWIAWRQLRLESERACDDAVVAQAEDFAYAQQLVTLARRFRTSVTAPLLSMADRRTLATRVAAIMNRNMPRGRVGARYASAIMLGAAALSAAISPLRARSSSELNALDRPVNVAVNQSLRAAPNLRFAVASIRPSPIGATRDLGGCCSVRYLPGGRVSAVNVGVVDLIVSAYQLQHWQVSGGPSWVDPDMMVTTDRYTIEAAADGDTTVDQLREMLRALLADRFRLTLRPVTQTGRTYDLLVNPGGHKLQLQKVAEYRSSARSGGGRIIAEQMTMPDLARLLAGSGLQAVVNDRTGLRGVYKFSVVWTPDRFRLSGVGQPAQNGEPGIDPNGPTVFDALRDQLGLVLQETRGPIESVVIERVERPTPNDASVPPAPRDARADQRPSFEVASIRRAPPGSPGSGQGTRPGGLFQATNVSLVRLVQFAYETFEAQIVGGPDWIRNDRFDITAKAPADGPHDQMRLMMRALLEDRFKLRIRTEKRDMPMFELVLARDDRRLGPNLHDCSDKDDKRGLSSREQPFTAPRGGAVAAGDCSSLTSGVARLASARLQAVVVDKTSLKGEFRYDIYFGPDLPQPGAASPDLPSFATALREQLGLRLQRTRGMVDVVVIESVAQPTEN